MAYPSVDSPYGLVPVNLIGGQVFAGSTRQIPIAANSATAIYYGDVVKLASGYLAKDTGTTAATPVGVFLGCSYTDPVYGKTFRQYYPGSVNVADIKAYVLDDPDALFKVAVVTAFNNTTIGFVNRNAVGLNAVLAQNTGSTVTGNSKVGLVGGAAGTAIAVTSTWPLRIVDVVPDTALVVNPGSYTEVIVKWNQGMHQYLNPTGA